MRKQKLPVSREKVADAKKTVPETQSKAGSPLERPFSSKETEQLIPEAAPRFSSSWLSFLSQWSHAANAFFLK